MTEVDDKQPIRTLRKAIHLDSLEVVSSDRLLTMAIDEYIPIRREITRARKNGETIYACGKCGHAVYAPLDPANKKPQWKHYGGAPKDCPWWTGNPNSIRRASARQFQGQQESPLHRKIKTQLEKILLADSRAQNIQVEQRIVGDDGFRKPDVSCEYDGQRYAFEIQLSYTQIPIILDREDFYASEGIHLIWIVWDFEPLPLSKYSQTYTDVYFSHSTNLFSLDDTIIARSLKDQSLFLNVFAERDQQWHWKAVSLDELKINDAGLPYYFEPEPSWSERIKARWYLTFDSNYEWEEKRTILQEIIVHHQLNGSTDELSSIDIGQIIDALYSLEDGCPVNSGQRNLLELANSFLNAERRHAFARIFQYAAIASGNKHVLDRPSVQQKFKIALQTSQVPKGSTPALIIRHLFPQWAKSSHKR